MRPLSVSGRRMRRSNLAAPGLARRRAGKAFSYRKPSGHVVRDQPTVARIRKLAIPPAWTDVWIASDPHAHIQATGRDARGRKQYRYHPEWIARQDREKYGRLARFARALPALRSRVKRDLSGADTSRDQVLALLTSLLESTYIRVGNAEYLRHNRSYGLTTLEDRHVTVRGGTIRFAFRGKGGIDREVELHDRRLARLVTKCRDIEGKHLFQYIDHQGRRRPARSIDLNQYIAQAAGDGFSAKDFRTWGATLVAAELLDRRPPLLIGTPGRSALKEDVAEVACQLGNTPAICRKSYIHPSLLAVYQDEKAWRTWQRTRKGRAVRGLGKQESRLLRFLAASAR